MRAFTCFWMQILTCLLAAELVPAETGSVVEGIRGLRKEGRRLLSPVKPPTAAPTSEPTEKKAEVSKIETYCNNCDQQASVQVSLIDDSVAGSVSIALQVQAGDNNVATVDNHVGDVSVQKGPKND